MLYFLTLYLTIQVISLLLLPFSLRVFSHLTDRGYAFNKTLSLLVVALIAWFLISLNLLPFTRAALIFVLLLAGLVSALFSRFRLAKINRRTVIVTEIIFLIIFALTTYLKYRTAPINGTEKPMDFALINGILKSRYFPPNDAWYAGKTINYYYFGHYLFAFLSKLSGIPTQIIYTLALPLVFALTSVNIFGIVINLITKSKAAIVVALLTIALVLFGANLDTPLQIIKSLVFRLPNHISWWDPSRVIGRGFLSDGYITITEFPYFSLLLGDVHAHVIALIESTLFIGLLMAFFLSPNFYLIVAGSFSLAALAMTDPWEVPFYLLLALIVIIFSHEKYKTTLTQTIFGLVSFVLLIIPFVSTFHLIKPVNDPKPFIVPIVNSALIGRHTLPSEFLTIWLTHLFIIFTAGIIFWRKFKPHKFAFLKLPRPPIDKSNWFTFFLCLVGLLAVIFCEFFFISDLFTPPLERMNTVFKLYYQAWIFLSIGAVLSLGLIWDSLHVKSRSLLVPVICLLMLGNLTYFLTATPARLRDYSESDASMNGLNYLRIGTQEQLDDYTAISWLKQHEPNTVNIIEAAVNPTGENSYSDVGRISAATGLPTIIGWSRSHERLWRNNDPDINIRIQDVEQIYKSSDLIAVKYLLSKYRIKYVYLGMLEKASYPNGDFAKFNLLGHMIFSSATAQIYEIE